MAVRATRKAKASGGTSPPQKAAGTKRAASRKAPAKTAKSKSASPGPKKTAAGKSARVSATAKTPDATAHEFLLEQNEALKAELKRAQARISELEELNRKVANRIDWVIDSLQGAMER